MQVLSNGTWGLPVRHVYSDLVLGPGGYWVPRRRARVRPDSWRSLDPYSPMVVNYPPFMERLGVSPDVLRMLMWHAMGHPWFHNNLHPADEFQHRLLAKVGWTKLVRQVVKIGYNMGLPDSACYGMTRWITRRALPSISLEAGLIDVAAGGATRWSAFSQVPEDVATSLLCAAVASCSCLLDEQSMYNLVLDVAGPWLTSFCFYHLERRSLRHLASRDTILVNVRQMHTYLLRALPTPIPTRIDLVACIHSIYYYRQYWAFTAWRDFNLIAQPDEDEEWEWEWDGQADFDLSS